MTLSLNEQGEFPDPIGQWPVPARPRFVSSAAYTVLRRDLLRYVNEDIPGRSFLIAGHRGAGKTALVSRAVEDLRIELLRGSVKEEREGSAPTFTMQRPLLVKVHGPSLLSSILPGRPVTEPACAAGGADSETKGPKSGNSAATGAAGAAKDESNPADGKAKKDGAGESEQATSQAHVALIHLTLALYRALAAEFSTGAAAHAREAHWDARGSGEHREAAAQLALELDGGPEPALLRRYWDLLRRMPGMAAHASGLLWPRAADETLAVRGLADQALREIVAIATAGQAYRICAGKESYSLSAAEAAVAESALTASGNVTEILNRIGALIAGSLAGGAAAVSTGSAPAAVGIGVAAWLAGSVSLSWSSSRSRKRSQTLAYSFIRDRSAGTLERDLPLVIRRVRQAGLAPVFVLDELDKLDKLGKSGEMGASRATIDSIIKTLKHLITDHGFFCFLTDRDYFDAIEQAVKDEVYPTEHTYFSERVLVQYRPADLLRYLLQIIVTDKVDDERENLACTVLALKIIQRSKLNLADAARELTQLASGGSELKITADQVFERLDYRLAAALQLAIDDVLASTGAHKRLEEEPEISQLLTDALYVLPRAWEDGATEIDLSTLRAKLEERMRRAKPPAQGDQAKDAGPRITDGQMAFLKLQVDRLCDLLCDWDRLREAIRTRTDIAGCRAEDIVPEDSSALLTKLGTDRWRFLFKVGGDETEPSGTLDKAELVSMTKAFWKLLKDSGLSFDDLVTAGVFPAHFREAIIESARDQLDMEEGGGDTPQLLRLLGELRSVLLRRGREIGAAILLVDIMRAAAGLPLEEAPAVLRRLARNVDFKRFAGVFRKLTLAPDLTSGKPLSGGSSDIREWADEFLERRTRRPDGPVELLRDEAARSKSWDEWLERTVAHLHDPTTQFGPPEFATLLFAAARQPPGDWFRANLAAMTVGEWSLIALRSLAEPGVPPWVPLASLRVLGFGNPGLAALRQRLEPKERWPIDVSFEVNRILRGVEERPPGVFAIAASAGGPTEWLPSLRPLLAVAAADYDAYLEQIELLAELGLFAKFVDEQE